MSLEFVVELPLEVFNLVLIVAIEDEFSMVLEELGGHCLDFDSLLLACGNDLSLEGRGVSHFLRLGLGDIKFHWGGVLLSEFGEELRVVDEWGWGGELSVGDLLGDHMDEGSSLSRELVLAPSENTFD